MKYPTLLAIADWTHPSWLARATPARNERARAQAAADLLARYPQLAQACAAHQPWFAGALARPAYARLMRLCAALGSARALRLVVCAEARERFSQTSGLLPLTALQCHPRGEHDDVQFGAPVDLFNRPSLTAAGLAVALRATSGFVQRQWVQLRLPRECAESAARYRLPNVAPHEALGLLGDALQLLRVGRSS